MLKVVDQFVFILVFVSIYLSRSLVFCIPFFLHDSLAPFISISLFSILLLFLLTQSLFQSQFLFYLFVIPIHRSILIMERGYNTRAVSNLPSFSHFAQTNLLFHFAPKIFSPYRDSPLSLRIHLAHVINY